MTKKERIAVAVTGVVLFCVAALFSISIFLGALDFGFSSGRNVLFLLGGMLFSVYGFCSILIPVFFFVAGAFCLSAKWSVQRAFILLVSVIPFFTLVAAERTSLAIAAQDSNPIATVKIISLVAIALLLVVLEYLVTVTVAGLVEKALEQKFSFNEFFAALKNNITSTVFQTLKLKKEDSGEFDPDESEAENEVTPSRTKKTVQSTATDSAGAKHSLAPHGEASALDWSIDSEGNIKGSAAYEQNTSDAASTHKAKLEQVDKEPSDKNDTGADGVGDTAAVIDLIGEFEKNSLDLTVQITGHTPSHGDFEIYGDDADVKNETPNDDELFFEEDELLEDDFGGDENVEEIYDDFEDQEYLSSIDETEIQEIETSPSDNDDFEFYDGFQEDSEDEQPVDTSVYASDEGDFFDETQETQQQGAGDQAIGAKSEYFDEPAGVQERQSEPEYFDEPEQSGTECEYTSKVSNSKDDARESKPFDEPSNSEYESKYFDGVRKAKADSAPKARNAEDPAFFDEPFDESLNAQPDDTTIKTTGDEASNEKLCSTQEATDNESEYFDEAEKEPEFSDETGKKSEYFNETIGAQLKSIAETTVDSEPEYFGEEGTDTGKSGDFPEPHLDGEDETDSAKSDTEEPTDFPPQDEYAAENEADDFAEPVIDTADDTYNAAEESESENPPTQDETGYPERSENEDVYSTGASYVEESESEPEITQVDIMDEKGEPFEYLPEPENKEDEDDDISVVDEDELGYVEEETEIDEQDLNDEAGAGNEANEEDASEEDEYFGEISEDAGGDEAQFDEDNDTSTQEDSGGPLAVPYGEAGDDGKEQFTSLESIFKKMEQDAKNLSANTPSLPLAAQNHTEGTLDNIRPRKSTGPYKISEELLTAYDENEYWIIDQETENAAKCLKDTLNEFKIEAEVTGIRKGPVVTMFEILPAPGVKLSRIVALSDNIALRLAASSVRIVAPIPGKRAVGIEVPNKNRAIVSFRECIKEQRDEWQKMAVPVVLGKDIQGETQIMDLVKTPHLLIAGSTGAGKSVCVNSMILSILYKRDPHAVKLILIDPKIVELKLYNGIPHLLTPVITEPKKAMQALQYCLCEMERRYSVLDGMGCRDIASYNRKTVEQHIAAEKLPYIIVIIDEFADLMATTGKALESVVARLAAMSRAVGIHLVLATQRPSVDVITGLIKANIPSRIAFMVAAKMDSRIIIDQVGAEKLLGKGDMLYASSSDPFPVRIQGAFVSDQEVENVAQAAKEWGEPEYIDDEIFVDDEDEGEQTELFDDGEDPLYEKALDAVIQAGKASASYVQRKLSIGYNRAARLIEEMEERGIVGPANGSKPREIIHVP